MADFRVVQNDPGYETELAHREHAADKFMAKLFLAVFFIVTVIAFLFGKTFLLVIALCFLIVSIYKFIHAAFIKSKFRL